MSPNPLLEPLKSILVFNRRRIYIDNVFFRIHYVWTVLFLVGAALLVTSKMYIGDPIYCTSSHELKDIVKQYCYIHSTFTRGRFEKGSWIYEPAKENEIHPGIRPGVTGDRVTVHSYYQWVWCFLALQAITFYFPHWAWEKLERGTTMMLIGDLNLPMLPDEKKLKLRRKILLYLHRNRGYHGWYALNYALSEVANLLNIVIQTILTDYYLDNAFTTYGLKVLSLTRAKPYERDDALARVFPTVTACRLATGGVAFGKVQHDILCILPINILNEKIYICLWFWFLLVLISTIFCLIYRLLTLNLKFRTWMLSKKLRHKRERECAEHICRNNPYGEWFLIYKLSQNMDPVTLGDLVDDVDQAFRKWDSIKGHDEDGVALEALPPSVCQSPIHVDTDLLYARHTGKGNEKGSQKRKKIMERLKWEGLMLWDEEFV